MTTPPAKAGGFYQSQTLQQRLLRLRKCYCTTLTPEGSVRAYLARRLSKTFQILRCGLPAAAVEFEVVKERLTVPVKAIYNEVSLTKGESAIHHRDQSPCPLA